MLFAVVAISLLALHGTGALPHPQYPDTRLLGGEDAEDDAFPYMVSLNYINQRGHACGGSVLTSRWVLTAAHCCDANEPVEAYAGSVVLSSGGQTYEAESYSVHGDYDPEHYWRNDVCIVKLREDMELGDKIQQVTLASEDFTVESGESVLISGWGYTSPNGTEGVPDRMQVGQNYKAISNKECGDTTHVQMFGGYLCAQYDEGEGACNGDSGSPLMKDNVQIGVASWVIDPCGSGQPDFYARVSFYNNFIKQVLGDDADDLLFSDS